MTDQKAARELQAIPYRYKNALAWRVASDLCRRETGLVITFPEGGSSAHANSLMIARGQQLAYEMRRAGGWLVPHAAESRMLSWEQAFARPNPRTIVVELEVSSGIHIAKTPMTQPRAIGYRLISATLDVVLHDRRRWDWYASSQGSIENQGLHADSEIDDTQRWTPEVTRWHLSCDGEKLAEVDSFGWIKTSKVTGPLLPRYKALGGKVGKLVTEVLGDILP